MSYDWLKNRWKIMLVDEKNRIYLTNYFEIVECWKNYYGT